LSSSSARNYASLSHNLTDYEQNEKAKTQQLSNCAVWGGDPIPPRKLDAHPPAPDADAPVIIGSIRAPSSRHHAGAI